MSKRRKPALAVLALAAAAVFVLPASSASAASSTVSNACANSVTANFSQIEVTTSGDDGLTEVAPGGATTTSGLGQSAAIPGDIFVAGYNLGLLVVGTNNIPANVRTTIEATNTAAPSVQNTNVVGGSPPNGTVSVTTVITDPDGTPGTGDETATDASFSVSYNNLSWTAGAAPNTINYRQDPIPTAPPTALNNSLLINALVGGIFNVQFRCAPGTVTGPDPGVITLNQDPAPFDTTNIVEPDDPPIANAGADQTVTEGDLVTLDGTGSSDPNGEALTYNWTAPAGITLSDPTSPNPTFTAPQVDADTPFTFTLEVCDEANPAVLCSDPDDTVVVTVLNVPASTISIDDASALEGGAVDFTVSLSAPQAAPVTVDFATADGSATAPGDYTSATGTVTFAPGDTSEPVSVQTIDDADVEGPETFDVNLSNPMGNATIDDGLGVGTIIDNDEEDLPPTANAGADQTVNEGDLVTLDGTGSSDPNGEALTYNWTAPAGITLSDPTSPTPTFTAPQVDADTPLTFTLEVCDEAPVLCSDPDDTVVVTVLNVDQPPTANAGPDQTVTEGDLVTLAGSGSDPDGEAVTFNWTAPAGITLSDPTSPTPTFTAPDVATSTPFTLTLEVCDEANPDVLCATDEVVITVDPILVTDATGLVIVNGPVSSTKTSKSFVYKVTNVGMTPITLDFATDITGSVTVNGALTGTVTVNPGTKTLNPGQSTRVKLSWSYAAGDLATGDTVVFSACVSAAGDIDPTNDCDDQTATAK